MHLFGKRLCAMLLVLCMLAGVMPFDTLAAETTAQVEGQQLKLGDDLSMHFYTKVEDATNAVATITVGGQLKETYNLATMEPKDGLYDLSVHLGAPQMTEDIVLSVSDGNSEILNNTYSVQDYAHYLLKGNYTVETKNLVKELLNYGTKAQLYFMHKTDDLANVGYEIDTPALTEASTDVKVEGSVHGIYYYGSSMVFRSQIAIRYYFAAPNGIDGYTVTVDGEEYKLQVKNDLYYVEVNGIMPDEMATEMTVAATDGTDTLSFTYSPKAYIARMYNKESTSQELKNLLAAAGHYFSAAAVFTGVAEIRTGSLNFAYRYGTANLIQVNTNIPADTPCVNFTAGDNGCSIDQNANQYQQFGWVGMDNVDGVIVLTFHFNAAFEAGQTYTLPKGAVFGFTDQSKYTLDKDYTFTFDGSNWSMVAAEPAITLTYRYGTANLIQFNTNLPSDTPCANFLATDNGCSLTQNVQAGWIGMDNVDGTIVLSFHFNADFAKGDKYTLSAGSIFGFTDGSAYQLREDVTYYWDGSAWTTEEPAAELPSLSFQYRYGEGNLIQVNTNLPATTPIANFTTSDNGCNIDESGNTVQWVGWIGMDNVDGVIVLTFHFNTAFTAGQSYVLPKDAVFGFTDGSSYALDDDYTFTFDGSSWTMDGGTVIEPEVTEPEVTEPEVTEPALPSLSFQYRYGTNSLIQVNTNLPATTPIANFLAADNGCNIIQGGNQQVGWIAMANVDGTIVLTFNFNSAFEAGQTYTLAAGSVFGFTDGSSYALDDDYTFTFDGSNWTMDGGTVIEPEVTEPEVTEPEVTEPALPSLSFQYRYGTNSLIQVNTNLPATTPIANFLTADNGCNIIQGGNQQVGWIAMANADGTIVLTFNFNSAFEAGQTYTLAAGSVFGFTDGSSYALDDDYTFTFDGSNWTMDGGTVIEPEVTEPEVTEPALPSLNFQYRYGTNNLIQVNTNLPASTPCVNFTADQNGCSIDQSGNTVQWVGWIGMDNVDGTIVLTFHFNHAFTAGQSYVLPKGAVFGFTDGSSYALDGDYTFTFDGSSWAMTTTAEPENPEPALPGISFQYRYGTNSLIQVNTNLPASTPCVNFTADQNGCSIDQSGNTVQWVGWIGMENADGTIVLTFHFNNAFTAGQSYVLPKGAVFGFTDGSSYALDDDYTFTFDGSNWTMDGGTVIEPEVTEPEATDPVDVLDESNFTGGKDYVSFADLPVDSTNTDKIKEYKDLGFNTALLAEDHTGAKGPDELFAFGVKTGDILTNDISFRYRYGTANLIQVNTNLPSDTPCVNFTASDNGCIIDQSANRYQQVGWIGMDNVDGTIVLTFHFNANFEADQTYVLPKGAIFGFTNGSMYTLDQDYTFTFDGASWALSGENAALHLTLNSSNAKLIQLKTNIPTGLTYGDFLESETGDNILKLEKTDGALPVAWFTYAETVINAETGETAVFFNLNFGGIQKPGTTYTLKKGTALKAGNTYYTLQADYTFTLENAYLTSLENLDNAGLNIWIRNYHNTADYFTDGVTAALALYKDQIDGFYVIDEAFQTNALLQAAGQESYNSDFESMTAVRDWFSTNFADKYFHANHVPITSYDHYTSVSGGTLSDMDADGYRNFLQTYKTNYNDKLTNASGTSIGFDNYPFIHAQGNYKYGPLNLYTKFESGIESSYLLNALIAAQVAGEDDLSICVQTFEASDLEYKVSRDITSAAEVSLQLYTGMAMGADVFEYFAYNSNGDFKGILNADGSKRIYDIVKAGNGVLSFHDVVNTFTWNGIVTSAGSANSHNGEGFGLVSDLVLADDANGVLSAVASSDDAIVGCFTKGSLNGYMVVNFNDPVAVTGNNTVTLTFADCTRARVYTCVDGVLSSQIVDLTDGSCTVTLVPGSGCFVIPA